MSGAGKKDSFLRFGDAVLRSLALLALGAYLGYRVERGEAERVRAEGERRAAELERSVILCEMRGSTQR